MTALPSSLTSGAWDLDKSVTVNATALSYGASGCTLVSPGYRIERFIESANELAAGDALMVADFVPAQEKFSFGFLYACAKACILGSLDTDIHSVQVFDEDTKLDAKPVAALPGVNRLVMAVQGNKALAGHLRRAEIRTHSVRVYLLPVP